MDYVEPFVLSMEDAFEMLMGVRPRVNLLDKSAASEGLRGITGVIGFAGEHFTGSLALCFDENVVTNIYEAMVGERPEKLDADVLDAVGEIANIVAGGAKTRLSVFKINMDLAIPNVIIGKGVKISFISDAPVTVIPFSSDLGDFVAEVTIARV